jgi:hypothetical protein
MPGDNKAVQCGVCGVLLNELNGEKVHAGELLGKIDHITVPVPFNPQTARYKCDFCGDVRQNVTEAATLPANDFPDPIIPNAWARGGWAACPTCTPLVAAGDWDAIHDRAMADLNPPPAAREAVANWLRLMHLRLQENITGPLQPYQPGDENW